MDLQLDPASAVPIYAQIVDQIRALVATRALRPGDRLPSVRELAAGLRVNRNTAAKAYQALESDGVVETRAGQGCFVADGGPRWSRAERYRRMDRSVDRTLVEAHHLEIPMEELPDIVDRRIKNFSHRPSGPTDPVLRGGLDMGSNAIVIDGFTKTYGNRTAVDSLSIEVPQGSIFGLLGQNGAGKSTTIKTLLNLLQPTAGRLSVLGLDSIGDSVALRRKVGYLPEEPAYYAWMTVEEIVRFNASFYPTWDAALADSLLKQLDLPRDRKLRELSRGMQAKVGLVMALGSRPEVLVLDDPTSGLDAIVRHEFSEAMIGNVQARGARSSSHRTCCTRWSASPTTWRSCTRAG